MLAVLGAMMAAIAAPGLTLRWEAPAGCPGEAEVLARVIRMTGEEAAGSTSLQARGKVQAPSPGRWTLDLELVGETGKGHRSLEASRCEELAEAAALVVAIAVDPRASGLVPAPPGEGEVSKETGYGGPIDVSEGAGYVRREDLLEGAGETGRGEVESPERTGGRELLDGALVEGPGEEINMSSGTYNENVYSVDDDNNIKSTWGGAVEVGLRAGAGVSFASILPRTSAALSVAVSVSGRRWQAEFGGLYAPPVAGGSARIGGVFQAGALALRGCPVVRRGQFAVPLCVGLLVGAIEGSGRGTALMSTRTERALWLAGTAGAGLEWRGKGRVGLWLQADAIVGLVRPSFVTTSDTGGRQVHQAARLGGQALAGVMVRLR